MRIDLFLKVTGLLKTRSIASKAIGAGAVELNGSRAKASSTVETGAVIGLIKPDGSRITIKVLIVPTSKNVSRKDRSSLYDVAGREEQGCW
ncbi:MAG: RNA-binding S4 domain-containing protein [Candidatus Sabulitectum sp.]|nr:RNA-binding S4 domain-containing protein [Candidatus Sabulitectum sp.]